ncbi:hypothetical protein DSL72_003657 [Monilinia vaccinii-corymbosi]|uniref:Uncharacterized protein n=1 Tax=Monilinia vaccinii-corymbosi TaxID=61207 RepID=A0A8A3P1V2_9HELO|nr:hypothetical protein DSL72_003657 [Monilinia vaccinii-corymbosi]
MENKHHSRKRKLAHEHESRHGEPGRHGKHNHHDVAQENRAQGHSPRKVIERRQPRAMIDQNELSGDVNYVRTWLAQTQNEGAIEPSRQHSPGTDLGHLEEKAMHSPYSPHTTQKLGENRNTVKPKLEPDKERTSSDSSMLKVPTATMVNERTRTRTSYESHTTNHGEGITRSHEHRKNAPSSVTSSSSQFSVAQPKQETFEKRARHKTREDRYETKRKVGKADVVEKPIRMRREKKGDRRKAARKASEDLMNNFASNKIGQDRLTARPSNGPGIFQNGRASSPPRRRGLPDLAFSEMEFLQRSRKKDHLNDTIIVPKSHVKEKRKAAREQDEIATFFKPSKTPIRDNNSTFEHPTSLNSIQETSLYEGQLRRDSDDVRHRCYMENLRSRIDNTETYVVDSRSQRVQSNKDRFPREPTPNFPSEEVGNREMHSESTNTIVTWSDSQRSPGATIALRQATEKHYQRQHSTTPDSVRSSIEKTRIFKDTGIENPSRRRVHLQETVSTGINGVRQEHRLSTSDGPVEIGRHSSRLSPDSANISHEIDRPPNGQQQNHVSQLSPSTTQNIVEPHLTRRPPDPVEVVDEGRRRVVVEYYDPNRGWYREENLKSPTLPSEQVAAPVLIPLTRQQMACNARIKRPSTTLPVIREASDESEEDSPFSISSTSGKGIQRTKSAPVDSLTAEGDMCGDVSKSHRSVNEGQEKFTLDPPGSEPIPPPRDFPLQHTQYSRPDQPTGMTREINRNATLPSGTIEERERQARTGDINGRIHIPLGTTSRSNPNREDLPFLTRPPFRRGLETHHEAPRQDIGSIPRSPLIRLRSLYVQQLEHDQEQDDMTNCHFHEKVEECGTSEGPEPDLNTDMYAENWDHGESEEQMAYDAEDVFGHPHYLCEHGPPQTHTGALDDSQSRPEGMGFGYADSYLYLSTDGYAYAAQEGAVRNEDDDWDRGAHFGAYPWIEGRRRRRHDSESAYEMNDDGHGNPFVPPFFRGYRELDEGPDGNASESTGISMARFWRPNVQY